MVKGMTVEVEQDVPKYIYELIDRGHDIKVQLNESALDEVK